MTAWDGVKNSYIPAQSLTVHPSLRLHAGSAVQLDPITYEVIRHGLYNVNEEHGTTIEKISGSPFATDAHDFNSVILTEEGEHVFFGPHAQFFAGGMDLPIKWTLENYSESPGIHDGDMLLCNDPWIGAVHQSDVQLMCPVFWEDELFCWVANAVHQYDVGGIAPGSVCAEARDVFDEPLPMPPIKIMEGGRIRADVERLYLRQSRQPQLLGLDLRAQVAGNAVARDRILDYVRRYGPDTVKAVMRKINDDGEKVFLKRLRTIPDGSWSHLTYAESAVPQDRNIYPFALTVTKRGDTLIFENEGTGPQTGSMNCTFASWRAMMLTIINPFLGYDLMYAAGGPLRHLEFRPTAGTMNTASHPASVSSPNVAMSLAGTLANVCLGKMVASSPQLREEVFATAGCSVVPMSVFAGTDQRGESFGTAFLDVMGAATGAFSHRDGIDTGGMSWDPKSLMPNVESTEQRYPLIYLYRKELPDSGGAGTFRGGNSAVLAVVPHGTEEIMHAPASGGFGVPTGVGLSGGHPACTNRFLMRRDAGIAAAFESGRIPQSLREMQGRDEVVSPRPGALTQYADDVWELYWNGGGGFGDPLDRDPQRVRNDVVDGNVTTQAARQVYGVILSDDSERAVDEEATARWRRARREEWRNASAAGERAPEPRSEGTLSISSYLYIATVGEDRHYCCARCYHTIAPVSTNYKTGCTLEELPASQSNPNTPDTSLYVDTPMVFRSYHCANCGGVIDTEIARAEDGPLWDIRID